MNIDIKRNRKVSYNYDNNPNETNIKRNRRASYNYSNSPVEYETSTYTPTEQKRIVEERKKEEAGIWDSLIEKIGETKSNSFLGDALKNQTELESIDQIKKYQELCKKITIAKNELDEITNGQQFDENAFNQKYKQLLDLQNQKNEYDDYFLSNEGRQSKVISEVMYNNPDFLDKVKYASSGLVNALDDAINTAPNGAVDFVWGGIKKMFNIAAGALNTVENIATSAYGEAKDMFGSDNGTKYDVLASIQNPNQAKSLYRGVDENIDLSAYDKYLNDTQQRELKNKEANIRDYNYYNQLYKEGRLFGEDGIKIASPEKISDSFRKAQEEGVGWNPDTWKYIIPELGSTISMYQHTAAQSGIDLAIRAAIKTGEWYLLGGTTAMAQKALEAGDAAKYAAIMSKLPSLIEKARKLRTGLNAVDMAQALYFTRQSRIEETNGEAVEAYSERVKQLSGWNEMTPEKRADALDKITTSLKNIGVDTSLLNENDKLSAALSYGIKIGDRDFDNSLREARKGLMKVINGNNALAYLDYLETLPFMNYGSAVLEKASSTLAKTFAKDVLGEAGERLVGSEARKAAKELAENTVKDYMRRTMNKAVSQEAAKDLSKILRSLNAKTVKDYAKLWYKSIPATMLEEGVEEGVQYKLGEAYKRGEYDDYTSAEKAMTLPELMFDLDMSYNSIKDFVGLNPNSLENGDAELRKAMIIGGLSGALFATSVSHAGDLIGQGPISETIKQMRANSVVAKLTSEQYGRANDTEHIGVFFDAFKKVGVSPQRLEKALMNLRSYIPETNQDPNGPTTDFVDKDIEMMAATYNVYKSKPHKKLVEELGYKKGSEDHKAFVIQAVQSIFDVKNSMATMQEWNKILQEKRNTITQTIGDIIANITSGLGFDWNSATSKLKRYKPLVDAIMKIRDDFKMSDRTVDSEDFQKFVKQYNEENGFNFTPQEAWKYSSVRDAYQETTLDSLKFAQFVNEYNQRNYTNLSVEDAKQYRDIRREFFNTSEFNNNSVDTIIDNIFEYYQNSLTDDIKSRLLNKAQRLKDIRKLTGLDIYTDGLDGIVSSFEDLQKSNKDARKDFYENAKLQLYIGRLLLNPDTQSIFEELHDPLYKAMLTYGLHEAKRTLAAAYNPNLTLDPIKAKRLIFGESDASSGFLSIVKQYEEKLAKLTTLDEQNTNESENSEVFVDLKDKSKFALIKDRIAQEAKRKAIAHKMEVEDMPYTQSLVDAAEQGDQAAQERVETERELIKREVEGSSNILSANPIEDAEDVINEKTDLQKKKEKEILDAISKHKKAKSEERKPEPETKPEPEPAPQPTPSNEDDSTDDAEASTPEKSTDEPTEDPVITDDEAAEIESIANEELPHVPELEQQDGEEVILDQPQDDSEIIDRIQSALDSEIDAINDSVNDTNNEEEFAILDAYDKIDESLRSDEQNAVEQIDDQLNEDYVKEIEEIIKKLDAPEEDIAVELAMLNDYRSNVDTNKKALDALKLKENNELVYDDAVAVDMVSKTMFYQPDSEKPIDLSVDGKPVKLPYTLKSGKELSLQLEKKDWINGKNVKKYYIVTRDRTQTNTTLGNDPNDPRSFSVILIILDDDAKACYATAMRRLGKHYYDEDGSVVEHDFYKEEEARLLLKGTVEGTTMSQVKSKVLDLIAKHYDNYKNTHARPKYKNATQYREYIEKENPDLYYEIELRAREFFAKPHSRMLTRAQIREQLAILDKNRTEIINAYLERDDRGNYVFPEEVKIDKVHPKVVRTSNGSINTKKNNFGAPIYRKIVEGTVDQIQKLFNSKKLIFALGLGVRGSDPFKIRGLSKSNDGLSLGSTASDNFNGIGLSGKIYMIVESNNGNLVPIMLSERKFNEQQDKDGNTIYLNNSYKTRLVFDGLGNVVDENFKPSPAEVLLYLICKKNIGDNNYGLSPQDLEFLKNLFINEGEHTMLGQHEEQYVHNMIASKQLWFDGEYLNVGIKDEAKRINFLRFKVSDLFNDSEQAVANRQLIVDHISRNLHFNTDEVVMSKLFSDSFIDSIVNYMNELDVDEVDLFGCPYMNFKRSDLVHNEGGRQVNNHMTGAAWMVATEKLRTDTDERVLAKPFLYAAGIAESEKSPAKAKVDEVKGSEVSKGVIVREKPTSDMLSRLKNMKSKFKLFFKFGSTSETQILEGEDKKKHLKDVFFDQLAFEHVILDMSTIDDVKSVTNSDDFLKLVEAKLSSKEFKQYLKDQHGIENFEIRYTSTKDLLNKCKERTGRFSAKKAIDTLIPEVVVKKDGEQIVAEVRFVKPENASNSAIRGGVTGVFSTAKGTGKLDANAKKWLQENLGLDEHLTIVTNAVIRSCSNGEEVYGLLLVAADMMNNPFVYITINSQYGEGLQYHEAWHYVNLLLHNRQVRAKLYSEYVKNHPELKGALIKDVEEAMANDFQRYMLLKTAKGLSGVIRRLFDDIKTFIRVIAGKKQAYRKVYAAISNGKYANVKLDSESLKEFLNRYKDGVTASFSVPGIKSKTIASLGDITYQSFYQIGSAINEQLLNDYDINTETDLMEFINSKNLGQKIKESIDSLIQANSGNEGAQHVLRLFKDNDELLLFLQTQTWSKYGVKLKTHKKRNETADTSAKLKEDNPDNIWDRIDATVSRKDNAAGATKLFFSRIPKYKGFYGEDGKLHYEREYTEYNVAKVYDLSETWTNVLENLHNCDSYGELDENGEYKANSLMGIVTRLSKSNAFFTALLERLNSIDNNVLLKSLIFATCNSSKIQIMFTNIFARDLSDDTPIDDLMSAIDSGDLDSMYDLHSRQMLDQKKQFSLYMDNTVQAVNQTPRIWSKNVVCLGMLNPDGSISKAFVDSIDKLLTSIRRSVNKLANSKKSDAEKKLTLTEIKFDLVDLYNSLGMDVDMEVLDLYINMQDAVEYKENPSVGEQVRALETITGTVTKGNSGSLENIITILKYNQLLNKKDKSTIGTLRFDYKNSRNKKVRPVDQLYNNYREDKNGNLSQMLMLAKAHNIIHPSSSEFSITGPNGDRLYPIGLNNMITDSTRWLDSSVERVDNMLLTPYNAHSVILNAASTNLHRGGDRMFELLYNAGMKDSNKLEGEDYMSLTPIEDYVQKIEFTQRGYFILPTMADKKTWYCIRQKRGRETGIQDFMLSGYTETDRRNALKSIFKAQISTLFERLNAYVDQVGNTTLADALSYLDKFNTGEVGKALLRDSFEDTSIDIESVLNNIELNYNLFEDAFIRKTKVDSNVNAYAILLATKSASNTNGYKRFSDKTLNTFAYYFLDELNAVIDYYSEKNVKHLTENRNAALDNFDGKIENGRLLFGGNGGKFRYFLDVDNNLGVQGLNLNQLLQVLYELLQLIEAGEALDSDYLENNSTTIKYIPESVIEDLKSNKDAETDGFELIRSFLNGMRDEYFKNSKSGYVVKINADGQSSLRDQINEMLIQRVEDEVLTLTGNTIKSKPLLSILTMQGLISNLAIPEYLFEERKKELKEKYAGQSEAWYNHNAIYMMIANHVANTVQSIIEFEKIYAGDPAYYSWKPAKDPDGKKKVRVLIPIGEQTADIEAYVDNLVDRSSDKIKRLGSLMSPGEEIKTDYTEDELDDLGRILGCKTYSTINVSDVKATSLYADSIKRKFRILLLYDYFVNTENEAFDKYVEEVKNKVSEKQGKAVKISKFNVLDGLYNVDDLDQKVDGKKNLYQELWGLLTDAVKKDLKSQLEKSIGAFIDDEINVADAQVMIRPEMYRKARMGLGQWSVEPDINGYSDELAYSIITGYSGGKLMSKREHLELLEEFLKEEEKEEFRLKFSENPDAAWLHNHKLAAIVSKFEMYPLKMSYFQNEYQLVDDRTVPMLNKMAIFPWFKHNATSETGKRLYDRMNRQDLELDMLVFESAVKVGGVQNKANLVEKGTDVDKQTTTLSDVLEYESDVRINYETGKTENRTVEDPDKTLAVRVQQVNCLRMLLNTEAHHDNMRDLGTQMFKLAFSNIVDEVLYGSDTKSRGRRSGHRIKNDIMSYVDELTARGYQNLLDQFFRESNGKMVIDNGKVRKYIKEIVRNNNMGSYAQEVIERGGSAACLPSRRLFENSTSAKVNANVISIETQGGTAVQQSVFGFFAAGNDEVSAWRENKYANYNGGQELKWDSKHGSMLVMLSVKFFLNVIPGYEQKTDAERRQWLIDNGIIGSREIIDESANEELLHLASLYSTRLVDMDLSVRALNAAQSANLETFGDLIFSYTTFINQRNVGKKIKSEIDDLFDSFNIDPNTANRPNIKKRVEYAKPFGLGYRIPTQGMSSIFVMQVADVLPAESGDLIIVPREFTAQTGSDFDVDKLFLSTLRYNVNDEYGTSELYNIDWEKANKMGKKDFDKYLTEQPVEVIQNALLMSYMDVVGDKHNAMLSRGSIDTTTGIIKKSILPAVQKKESRYPKSFEELTPSFQSFRKMEFSAGKDGIGSFALNVTNMTLVQYAGLSMDFSDVADYELNPLYSTHGKDGILISNWLSAMINAMVDVAKDPYVFDINVIKETYNMSNFLIRTGNGGATFTFMAQPAIKEYVSRISAGKGLYGTNITENKKQDRKKDIALNILKLYLSQAIVVYDQCVSQGIEIPENIRNLVTYWNTEINGKDEDKEKAVKPSNKSHDILNQKACTDYLNVLNAPESEQNKYSLKLKLDALISQVLAVDTYVNLSKYANAMSKLVLSSRIDTEKFGNNIPEQILFKNKLELFMYSDQADVTWTLKDEDPIENKWDKGSTEYKACIAYNNQRALNRYFNGTYLMDKFNKAHRMMRLINQHQLIDATQAFNKIFSNYLLVIGGVAEYNVAVLKDGVPTFANEEPIKTFDGNKIQTDTAIDVANAIESIMLFKILMNQGPKRLSRYKGYSEELATGPIDFTCNGNIDEVVKKMAELSIGDNTIVDRLLRLRQEIQSIARMEDPTPEQYSMTVGLVDENGNITNDLLSYVVGVKANAQIPIDHIVLETSAMNTDVDKKNVLYSAFGQLLEHDNIKVRLFARDLAFYAYHSQYNQNTTNSFFDLVPYEYAKQYIESITLALHNQKALYESVANGIETPVGLESLSGEDLFESKLTTEGGIVDTFIDIIARNFYKNNNIVPLSKTDGEKNVTVKKVFKTVSGTGSKESKLKGDDIYFTNKEIGGFYSTEDDAPYVKIVKNGSYRLYKKVAVIQRVRHRTGKNPIKQPPLNLYVRVPLAGVNTHSIKLFEFYADFGTMSVFNFDKKSKIGNKLRPQNAIDFVLQKAKDEISRKLKKEDETDGVTYEFVTELLIPSIYTRSNEDIYYSEKLQKSDDTSSNNFGTFGTNEEGTVYYEKRSSSSMTQRGVLGNNKPADVIIDLNNDEHVKNDIYSNKSHTISNSDITSNNVMPSMLSKLQSSGVFETDAVTEEVRKNTSANVPYGVMKNSTGAFIAISGEFEGVDDIDEATNLARKLLQQLIFGGIDIRKIRYEGGSITSIALSKAINEYAELMYGSRLNEPIGMVFFDSTKLTDDLIKEEINVVANDTDTLEKQDVIQQELLMEVVQNRNDIRRSLIDAYDILKQKAKQQEKVEELKESDLNELMSAASDFIDEGTERSNENNAIIDEHKDNEKNHEQCAD